MLHYTSIGPNPLVVTLYLREKGLTLPSRTIDIVAGENRQPDYLARVNAAGEVPALGLDSGAVLSDSIAICEYLDEADRAPGLIGRTAEERAETRMWIRRVDIYVVQPMTAGFRAVEYRDMFAARIPLVGVAAGSELKETAQQRLAWFDAQLAGRSWLAGERFSLADILLYIFLAFGKEQNQGFPAGLANLSAWFARVAARPAIAGG